MLLYNVHGAPSIRKVYNTSISGGLNIYGALCQTNLGPQKISLPFYRGRVGTKDFQDKFSQISHFSTPFVGSAQKIFEVVETENFQKIFSQLSQFWTTFVDRASKNFEEVGTEDFRKISTRSFFDPLFRQSSEKISKK